MSKLEFLEQIHGLLHKPNQNSLDLSMQDVHHEGLFSLVIGGNEHGRLIRVFIADRKVKPFAIQLHTHRYPIRLTVIKGNVKHHVAQRTKYVDASVVQLSEFEYKSPLNGGNGLKYLRETNVVISDYTLPVGSTLTMTAEEFHSVSCSKGSMWIVEEQGFKDEGSLVLGVPFITEGLYNTPAQYQVNDKAQAVLTEIKSLILDYKLVQ